MMKRWFLILMMLPTIGWAQKDSTIQLEKFLDLIRAEHPKALIAELQIDKGDAYLMKAKGHFDPKLSSGFGNKQFGGTHYYSYSSSRLSWQSPLALKLEGGYDRSGGVFLNPQNKVPKDGLMVAGISVPLGQGLFIDQARADLKQARYYQNITKAYRLLHYNELIFKGTSVYLDWLKAFNAMKVYESAYTISLQRFQQVKQSVILGDLPAIDTVEAGMQVQNRLLKLLDARLALKNAKLRASTFVWENGATQLDRFEQTMPVNPLESVTTQVEPIVQNLDSFIGNHPKLNALTARLNQLDVEERWKKEQLKPDVDIKYQPIAEAMTGEGMAAFSSSNYQWGLGVAFPLFLRKERGALELVRIEQQETELSRSNQQNELMMESIAALNALRTYTQQLDGAAIIVDSYFQILRGERMKFQTGESSLFMINSREINYINAQIKLIELDIEARKAANVLFYDLGMLR
jgi:outer membrane protein TolC